MSDSKENNTVPPGLYYTRQHEWVRLESNIFTIGISDFAQKSLGDIVYLDISVNENSEVSKEQNIGVVESVKAVGDIYAPVEGKLVAINTNLKSNPEEINKNPYDSWMVKIESVVESETQIEGLMDAAEYAEYTENIA